jgi:hypothetical protein
MSGRPSWALALAGWLAIFCAARATAEREPPPPAPDAPEFPTGRAPAFSPRNELLLVPRLVLSLPRTLLRQLALPLKGALILNERYQIYQRVLDALTSRDGLIGVRLAFDFALDYQPMLGFSFFDERIVGPHTALYLKAEAGPGELVVASALMRPLPATRRLSLDLETQYTLRDDQVFRAIASLSPYDPGRSRYTLEGFDLWARPRLRLWRSLALVFVAQLGVRRFADGRAGGDPPISALYCARALGRCLPGTIDERLVPGFNRGSDFGRVGAILRYDGFDRATRPSAGAQLDVGVHYTHGMTDPLRYVRVSAGLGVAIDVWQRSHVLLLSARSDLVLPVGDAPVPFSELALLGGADSLRGVLPGRFRDYSTLLVSAEYRWPIWMWADAMLFSDWGGAAGKAFAGIDFKKLVPDVGAGIRIRTSEHVMLRGQLAWGYPDGVQVFLSLGSGL